METTVADTPLNWGDDFLGPGHNTIPNYGSPATGYPWVRRIVGAGPPTVGILNNVSGGILQLALTATSEAEESSLYANDILQYGTTGTTVGQVEWRSQLTVAPTSGAQAFLGLGSAWVGSPLTLAIYMGFLWNGSAGLTLVLKDGNGHNYSINAAQIGGSAITTDTANYHVYRIDWSNPADIAFFVDANRVNAVNSMAWGPTSTANGVLQPWHTVYKASGTGVATLQIDKIDIFSNR